MLALWYNGISARVGRARTAQLYHIFGNLSIGKIDKKLRGEPLKFYEPEILA